MLNFLNRSQTGTKACKLCQPAAMSEIVARGSRRESKQKAWRKRAESGTSRRGLPDYSQAESACAARDTAPRTLTTYTISFPAIPIINAQIQPEVQRS
ncbi:hypothetical protein AAFF_G00121990 [Aldrovandia affinis]|uniref:Uncharacterized protein n=1 Tax=Aldrovandia affinis TaxID=143900 RepID=A0AAD7R112_9TELE|nr:hypothetical protein AAFF_G00121990 [Aldrovandia affinis]